MALAKKSKDSNDRSQQALQLFLATHLFAQQLLGVVVKGDQALGKAGRLGDGARAMRAATHRRCACALLVDRQPFKDRPAAPIAGVVAMGAAGAGVLILRTASI